MKRFFLLTIFLILLQLGFSQNVYFSRNGHVYFVSHTNAIDIDANNYQFASFFDVESGKIQFAALIKSFEFTLATAKEHFNESYMESDKFPKAEFKGQVVDMDKVDLTQPGARIVKVTGDITIRGIKKQIEVDAELHPDGESINAKSEFYLSISDFNIEVPKVVEHRVAKKILVKVDIIYKPYKK